MKEGQLGRKSWEPAQIAVRVSVLDFVITVFHVPQRVQFFGKTAQPPSDSRLRSAKEQGNEGSMRRNVCERPGPGQCQCDHSKSKEKAPPHSITSSARARTSTRGPSPGADVDCRAWKCSRRNPPHGPCQHRRSIHRS